MAVPNPNQITLSRRKRILFYLIYSIVVAVVFFVVAEIALRIKGYQAWQRPEFVPFEQRVLRAEADPTLGYRLLPGQFTISYRNSSFSYQVTHTSDGLRITHPLSTYTADAHKKEIWVFGCSFTHGESLNDEETYAWLLQEKLPDYEVLNFGVDGYSTVQSLIQFKEALGKRKAPAAVVVAYGSFHDERNASLRSWTKWNQFGVIPYARLGWDGKLTYYSEHAHYTEFPFMRYSAFMHYLEKSYDRAEGYVSQSHEISKALLKEFSDLCQEKGIKFVVAGIYKDPTTAGMLDYCRQQGILATDISVDLNIKENTNLPYDHHPNGLTNKFFAGKLEAFLSSDVLK